MRSEDSSQIGREKRTSTAPWSLCSAYDYDVHLDLLFDSTGTSKNHRVLVINRILKAGGMRPVVRTPPGPLNLQKKRSSPPGAAGAAGGCLIFFGGDAKAPNLGLGGVKTLSWV